MVTTVISDNEEDSLKAVAEKLGLTLVEEKALEAKAMPDPDADMDGAKKELEDLYNLM